jgi:hypothetical protein
MMSASAEACSDTGVCITDPARVQPASYNAPRCVRADMDWSVCRAASEQLDMVQYRQRDQKQN